MEEIKEYWEALNREDFKKVIYILNKRGTTIKEMEIEVNRTNIPLGPEHRQLIIPFAQYLLDNN